MKTSENGFTLVETVIAISVTAILIAIVLGFMTNSIVEYALAGARADILSQAQSAVDNITAETRLSGKADLNNRWQDTHSPSSPTDNFSWTSDNDTLVLATAVEDTGGNIVFADPAQYISQKNNIVFFLQNGTLYKRIIAAADISNNKLKTSCPKSAVSANCPEDRKLLENVNQIRFTYYDEQNQEVTPDNARSVNIYIKIERTAYNRPVSAEYSTRMVFRND